MQEEPLLRMTGISKKFGSVQALYKVDFELYNNEILGFVGDNGAGKTTLIKIISGVYASDEGEIFFQGKQVTMIDPRHVRSLGIETIYQDLALANKFSVAENIFLGREYLKKFLGTPIKVLDKRRMEADTSLILRRLRIDIGSPKAKVETLSGGQRQGTAVAKSVFWKGRVIIMDEPTAALGISEALKVRQTILNLKKQGVSIILISHNLEDIFSTADRVIILRGGQRVGARVIKETNEEEIAKLIIKGKK